MCSALKIKKLEKDILDLSFIRSFSEKFERIINLEEQPTLTEMRETYSWINDQIVDAVDPFDIKDLIRCRHMADQAFSRNKPLPAEIKKESQSLGRYLKKCYKHLIQTTDWKIHAGNLKIGRKVKRIFLN